MRAVLDEHLLAGHRNHGLPPRSELISPRVPGKDLWRDLHTANQVRSGALIFADVLQQNGVGTNILSARNVTGFVNTFGSSIVISYSRCPKSRRCIRSVIRNDSVWGCPPTSSHPRSLKPAELTTRVAGRRRASPDGVIADNRTYASA